MPGRPEQVTRPIPVYIISLERDPHRLRHVTDQLSRFDFLDLIWARAFSGRDLADPLCHILTGNASSHEHKGTLGCFISHLTVWHEIVRRDAPVAMVVEDNAGFSNCEVLSDIVFPPDFDLVFCNARTAYPDAGPDDGSVCFRQIDPVPAYVETHGRGIGTDGYFISNAGARKLLQYVELDRMFAHVDVRMLAYCLNPKTSYPIENLHKAGRAAIQFCRRFPARHRLTGYTMLPSLTKRARNKSTRIEEDEAGKQRQFSHRLADYPGGSFNYLNEDNKSDTIQSGSLS